MQRKQCISWHIEIQVQSWTNLSSRWKSVVIDVSLVFCDKSLTSCRFETWFEGHHQLFSFHIKLHFDCLGKQGAMINSNQTSDTVYFQFNGHIESIINFDLMPGLPTYTGISRGTSFKRAFTWSCAWETGQGGGRRGVIDYKVTRHVMSREIWVSGQHYKCLHYEKKAACLHYKNKHLNQGWGLNFKIFLSDEKAKMPGPLCLAGVVGGSMLLKN